MYKKIITSAVLMGFLALNAEVKPLVRGTSVSCEDRDAFEKMPMVRMEFQNANLRDVMNALALASGINYQLDKVEEQRISMQIMMNPFKALELLSDRNNLVLSKKNNMWFIGNNTKQDKYQKEYKLNNVHLGAMSYKPQKSEKKEEPKSPILNAGLNTKIDVTPKASDNQPQQMENFSNGDEVVGRIKELIAVGGEKDHFVSYDADSNTLFAVANDQQHAWIQDFIKSFDKMVFNVEMEIQFISSSENPESHLGMDWSGMLGEGMNISASSLDANNKQTGLNFGTLGHLHAPRSAIVSTDALNVKLQAWNKKSDNETKKHPLVMGYSNRPVILDFTRNEPVVIQTTATDIQTSTNVMASGTTSSSQITQERVGTVVKLLPRIIDGNRIALDMDVGVSNILSYSKIQNNLYPIISQTHYCGQTVVEGGNTIVVGGLEELISDKQEGSVSFLGNLPIFGWLFKDIKKSGQKKKLSLFISVRLLDSTGKEVSIASVSTTVKAQCLAKVENKMNEVKEAIK